MIELLAPAGGPDSIEAAVRCGADAVYLGGESFSARANAKNFSYEDLCNAVEYCHLHNVKVHQAINTVMFDSEAEQLVKTAVMSAKAGVDAFIVQDIGAAMLIKKAVPDMPLHASTQMSVHTKEGALFAKKLGFSRVVIARELSLEQIRDICSVNIEVEAFVHGALCMCVSGQCYMSAMIGSRSANRGLCAQACRLPFSAIDGQDRYDLSLKDMSLVTHISDMLSAGVCSLKIEGRMKRAEYVAAAVTACRQAIDGLFPDMESLRAVFSRSGFTDGYLTGKIGADMFGTRQKEDVVSAEKVFPKLRELYRKEGKCSEVSFEVTLKKDTPVKVKAVCGDVSADVSGDVPETANNRPTDLAALEKQLSKLGDTVYTFGGVRADIDEGLILSASQLNGMRRDVIEQLDRRRVELNTPEYKINEFVPEKPQGELQERFSVRAQVRTVEQACECLDSGYIDIVILPLSECLKVAYEDGLVAALPRFTLDEKKLETQLEELKKKGYRSIYCQNVSHIMFGKKYDFEMHGGFGLNVVNSFALEELKELGLSDTVVSFEIKLMQIEKLGGLPFGVIAYGRLPLMLTRICPVKQAVGECSKCTGGLTDRTGRHFPVVCDGQVSEILNCDVLSMSDRLNEIHGASFIQLNFTDENPDRIADILNQYKNGTKTTDESFTRGLYYRGII